MTIKLLNKILDYNDISGVFSWKISIGTSKIGKIAGSINSKGYIIIRYKKKAYNAHHLAWLWKYGKMPEMIDHINHIRSDNRLVNLREADYEINAKNMSIRSDNKSGVIGLAWNDKNKRWVSKITVSGNRINLGSFVKFSDAVDARKNAEVLYGFHTNHGTRR